MGVFMIRVLIADDESIVLEGLKYIIEWKDLGFSIIGEAKNGEDTLDKILNLQPDLVLLDIHMPKLHGTEVVRLARESNYKGHFIILSGYTDFHYAQTAIQYGVNFYLTKPIDEDELTAAVLEAKNMIHEDYQKENAFIQYRKKAKDSILRDILTGRGDFYSLDLQELHFTAPVYQVVIYEKYNKDAFLNWYNFAEILRVTNQDNSSFDDLVLNEQNIILLKGNFALQRFQDVLHHYEKDVQKGSPFDSIFLTYGHTVYKIEHIVQSYEIAESLLKRRFFCEKNQHILSYELLPDDSAYIYSIYSQDGQSYHKQITDYIQIQNRKKLAEVLHSLEMNLFFAQEDIIEIKHYLTDIYFQIKQNIVSKYPTISIPFPTNTFIIQFIESKYFLYEIILFFSEQFKIIMNAISSSSSEHVLEDILHYIQFNYMENLRLENIAHLFGYNSSYLGTIFSKKVGVNFNAFVDQVRVERSKELLKDESLKVYEVATRVGYKNVDYFHKKFKKYVNQSPAEYRRALFEHED